MGRIPMPRRTSTSREAVINIRVKHRQRELIDRAAEALGRNRRSSCSMPPAARPRTCCSTSGSFSSAPRLGAVQRLLDAPARDIPALRSLLASKPVWKA